MKTLFLGESPGMLAKYDINNYVFSKHYQFWSLNYTAMFLLVEIIMSLPQF